LMLAFDGGRIVGCMAAWDQSSFRQTVVESYRMPRWRRGIANLWQRLRGRPSYPPIGQQLPLVSVAVPLVAGGQEYVVELLLDRLRAELASSHCQGLLVGLAEYDPCLARLRRQSLFEYATRVYAVYWDSPPAPLDRLVNSAFYLELGCL